MPLSPGSVSQLVLDAVADGVHVLDTEGRVSFENRAAIAMFGWPAGALVGQLVHERVHHHYPDGRPYPFEACLVHRVLEDGEARSVERDVFFRHDGSAIPVSYSCTPLRGPGGELMGAVMTIRDLTARLAEEGAMRAREALLRDAQRIGQMGSWSYEVASGQLTWDEVTCQLFGVDPATATGVLERFTELVLPEDRVRVVESVRRVQVPGAVAETEYRVRRPDGALRWMRQRAGVEVDEGGAVVRRLGMVADVTAARLDAELLAHEAAVLEAISLGEPLRKVLDRILLGVQALLADGLPSVMRVDERGLLQPAAARGLPVGWLACIEDLPIGPEVGSCGTSAWRKEPVVVADLATDPLWTNYREAALAHGLRACWSLPVMEADGRVIATFVVYYREPRAAQEHELVAATRLSHLVRLALQREAREAALRASEEKFRHAFRDAAVGIAVTTLDGRFLEVNQAYCDMLGYTEAELRELDFLSLTHPDDQARNREFQREVFAQERDGFVIEKRYLAKGGREVWCRVSVALLRDEAGRATALIGVAEDLTRLKETEAYQRRFRELADAMPFVVWTATAEGVVDFVSAAILRYAQRAEAELVKDGWVSIVHPEDVLGVKAALDEAFKRGEALDTRCRLRRGSDGVWRWFSVGAVPARDAGGRIVKWYGSAADIDDVMRLEQEASRLARRLTTTLESITDVFVTYDSSWRFTSINPEAERLFGRPREELYGKVLWEEWPQVKGTRVEQEFRRAVAEQRVVSFEYTSPEMGRWFEIRCYPMADGLVTFSRDVTERKQLEAQLLRSQRLESIGTLAGGIAHDLNNVLAPILMAIELLRRNPPGVPLGELLDTIESSARRGAEMIRQVLSFARGMEGERGDVQPADLLNDLVRVMSDTLPRNVSFQTSLGHDPWVVEGDATQLHQVLINLCVNARDAMPLGGSLRVTAENVVLGEAEASAIVGARAGRWLKLEVTDTGTGIAREVLDRIFDPFFTTKEVGKGTGLGLSTSLGIVKSHGGFMSVLSEPGRGSTFRVYLPAKAATAEVGPEATAEQGAPEEGLPRGQGECVLVVDDEASIRQITRQTLEAFGYRVLLAADGAEAVAVFAEQRSAVNVVLLDMAMPVMDGLATIHALRRLDPVVPIVAVSGLGTATKVGQATAAGVAQFLPKPFTAEALLLALRHVLDRPPTAK